MANKSDDEKTMAGILHKDLTFHEKIVKIQTELNAPKSRFNKFGGYNYRNCEDIQNAIKPFLNLLGLVLIISDEIVTRGVEGELRFYVQATATLSDGENHSSVTAYARESEDKKGMDDSQITGSASSYARKYALNGLLCIDDTKDADNMDNTETDEKSQTKIVQPKKYLRKKL